MPDDNTPGPSGLTPAALRMVGLNPDGSRIDGAVVETVPSAGPHPDANPPKPKLPPFTIQQAQGVMHLARRAPLQNSDEADAVRELLNAYATFVNAVVPHE